MLSQDGGEPHDFLGPGRAGHRVTDRRAISTRSACSARTSASSRRASSLAGACSGRACVETFPPLEWLGRFYEESQLWGDCAIPRWFEDWLNAEREATTLRMWQPLLVPGLVQTADYAPGPV